MGKKNKPASKENGVSGAGITRLTALLLLAIIGAGALLAWWIVVRADQDMRADLLQQARLIAQAINAAGVRALSGTEADIDSPNYLRLKEQLAAVRSANPHCRFVYLMGRKADGKVFFFADSEPAGSKDYSPPGQVYEEATAGYLRVFDTRTEAVEGPVTDRWGTWVSALVPIGDMSYKGTGGMIAVLGMDIDASDWNSSVAAKAALPLGMMLVLLISAAAVFISTRRTNASARPILWRLLPSLAVIVILLIAGAGAILWQQQQLHITENMASHTAEVNRDLHIALANQAIGLATAEQPIVANLIVQTALREGDYDRLLTDWRPVFETMHREVKLTHFYFFDANRVCLLRLHQPERRGDIITRFTALEAERTGTTASGIELGPLGTFTLRVVQPVFADGKLVGYVELGKEIEEVLQSLRAGSGSELAVVIRKEYLNRQSWEDGMRLLGREPDWDRLSKSVVTYSSQGHLPDAFASWANYFAGDHADGETDREISLDGKDWRASASPLQDASGKEVGNLLVLSDITAEKVNFERLIVLGGTAGAVLLALLLSVIYILLRRTDAGIRFQQKELRNSEERYRNILGQMNDGYYEVDLAGKYTLVNDASCRNLGYSREELIGHSFQIALSENEAKAVFEAYHNVYLSGEPNKGFIFEVLRKDGTVGFAESSISLLKNNRGEPIGFRSVGRDITERKQAEEALRSAEEKYRILVENINDIFYMVDNQGNITYISPAVERLTMYKISELVGKPVFPLVHPDDLAGILESFNHLVSGQLVPWEFRLLDKDGRVIFVRTSRQLLYKDGVVAGITAVMTDITERKQLEQKLEEMATHDFLTGLPNRVLLLDRFSIAAALAHRNKSRLAVMSLDLDKFKTINDTLGHDAGDQVLKAVSVRLTGIIRASDTLARVGGDEFVLVMMETKRMEDSTDIARKILAAFKEHWMVDGHELHLSTSIGIAIYPEDGQDLETLTKQSDAAMYYSKGHGRNQFKFFGDGDARISGDHKSAPN